MRSDWSGTDFAEWTTGGLQDCARWWAAELGLGDWTLEAVFVHRHEIDGYLARCIYDASRQEMRIKVSHADERDQKHDGDLEFSVVHELLHARLWPADDSFDGESVEGKLHELAINRIAWALIRLRRRSEG